MQLSIPVGFEPEKIYVADFLFKEILGINYSLQIHKKPQYIIETQEGEKIIFKDAFFANTLSDRYIAKENLPASPKFLKNKYTPESDLPIIYGDDFCIETDKQIDCGIDIFASVFFMLSRWEELLIEKKDRHGRVDENAMYVVKHNLFDRNLVDEYALFLKNILQNSGIPKFKKHKYKAIFTHDVDLLYYHKNFRKLLRLSAGDIIKRRSLSSLYKTWQSYFALKFGGQRDIYDNYDFLMDISESCNVKSHFYFIAAEQGEPDFAYRIDDERTRKIIANINARGHYVGLHGSYLSFEKEGQLLREKQRIKEVFPDMIEWGRQHFLRFAVPHTWQSWVHAGMKTDSSLAFRHRLGFRAGTCKSFPVFDVLARQELPLREQPLIVMDVALVEVYPNKQDARKEIERLAEKIKKYDGTFVLLWHNNNFGNDIYEATKDFYREVASCVGG